MTHFEDFDRRKAEADEHRLRDALYALNGALPADWRDSDDPKVRRLARARDEVFDLGRDLYGWTD